LSASEFHNSRPLREAQGSPQGRVTWAFSFGSFSLTPKKMNKMLHDIKWFQPVYNKVAALLSHQIGRTYPGPPPESEGLNQN
jgi:hypothetical protein